MLRDNKHMGNIYHQTTQLFQLFWSLKHSLNFLHSLLFSTDDAAMVSKFQFSLKDRLSKIIYILRRQPF